MNDSFARKNNKDRQIALKKARFTVSYNVQKWSSFIALTFFLAPSKNKNQRLNLLSMWHSIYARFPGNTGMTLICLAVPTQLRPPKRLGVHLCFHGHGLPCLRCAHSTSGVHCAWRRLAAAWPRAGLGVYRFTRTHL